MNIQKFSISNRHDQKLVVVVNEHSVKKGLAFIMHGLGGFKEGGNIVAMESVFRADGYTTVVFDTTDSIGESGGEYEKATMEKYYTDLCDVIDWSKEQAWFQEPFVLAGHSMGGYSTVRFAEEHPESVKGVFAFAPAISGSLSHEAHRRSKLEDYEQWQVSGWKIRQSLSKPGTEMRLPWSHMMERLKHDLLPGAASLTMPICIIVGEHDESCPPDHQCLLFDAVPSEHKELTVIPGAEHVFRSDHDLEQLRKALSNWLESLH